VPSVGRQARRFQPVFEPLQPCHDRRNGLIDRLLGEPLGDMGVAVGLPVLDLDDDGPLHLGVISGVCEGPDDIRIRDDAGLAADLHPPLGRIIHQEQKHILVLAEIADGDVAPVAGIVGKAERGGAHDFQEACRPAAMLHIGPSLAVCGGHVEMRLVGDEIGHGLVDLGRHGRVRQVWRRGGSTFCRNAGMSQRIWHLRREAARPPQTRGRVTGMCHAMVNLAGSGRRV